MKAISVVSNRIIKSHHDAQRRRTVGSEKFGEFEESLAMAASLFTLALRRLGLTATAGAMGKS